MPLIIGVTGAIATGKSTVCETLQRLGAVHCDADKLVHRLYDPGTPGFERVAAAFGQEIVGPDGYIDRKILGSRVFGNPEAMSTLTRAIGSIGDAIHQVVIDWRATLPDDATAVLEAVNMIEPGYSEWLDQTWLVASDTANMGERLRARNQFDDAEVERRLSSQRAWTDRAPAADHVFHNDGTLDDLVQAVERQHRRVRDLYRRGELPQSRWHEWNKQRQAERSARAGETR